MAHTSSQIGGFTRGETGTTLVASPVNATMSMSPSMTSPASATTTVLKSMPGGITCSHNCDTSQCVLAQVIAQKQTTSDFLYKWTGAWSSPN
jgi:invasion protein IalB